MGDFDKQITIFLHQLFIETRPHIILEQYMMIREAQKVIGTEIDMVFFAELYVPVWRRSVHKA